MSRSARQLAGGLAACWLVLCSLHGTALAQAASPSTNGAQGLPGYQPGFPQVTPGPSTNGTTGTTGIAGGGLSGRAAGLQNVSRPGSPLTNFGQPQYKITIPKRCPAGYAPPVIAGTSHRITVCEVANVSAYQCAAFSGYYACGRDGSECCPPNQDNSCFPGAYACYALDAVGSGARRACCYDNNHG